MNTSTVIRGTFPFRRRGCAQEHDPTPATETTKASSSRIPRIARLLALACPAPALAHHAPSTATHHAAKTAAQHATPAAAHHAAKTAAQHATGWGWPTRLERRHFVF
jgi:hypothetical protein